MISGTQVMARLLATALVVASAVPAEAQTVVSTWYHSGRGAEREALAASVKAFNGANKDVRIEVVQLPEGTYSDQVNAAALAGKLPCLLDFDGPNVSNYAWSGRLLALDDFDAIKAIKADFMPTIVKQGTFQGKLYSLGQFDSGLAIWGNRKLLQKAGARIPKAMNDAWTLAELEDTLKKLKASGVPSPLDMKFNYGIGEWITYGFSPIVQSFGGDLIDRKTLKATGVLDGPASVQALTTLQRWVKAGYVNPGTKVDTDFVEGRAALSWVGHWVFGDYKKALGDDLVLIPMPRLGARAATGAGSWNWGISTDCKDPKAAVKALAFLVSKEEVARMTEANGAVPARISVAAASRSFAPGGPLRLYVEQLAEIAVVRPETPAYPVITSAFAEAVGNVVGGADPKAELGKAAQKIDQNIEDNQGYASK